MSTVFHYHVMELMSIEARGRLTSSINLRGDDRFFNFEGKPSNSQVSSFYKPLLRWLDRFLALNVSTTFVEFNLSDQSHLSPPVFLTILKRLESLKAQGGDVRVRWLYPETAKDIERLGRRYAEVSDIPFEQVSYKRR